MYDAFDWPTEPPAPEVKPVFDGKDPMAVVKAMPPWVPPAPTAAAVRPEWDIKLVIDVTLGMSKEAVCDAYGLQFHQYDRILADVAFQAKVATLKKELEKEGATFTLKAQLQAEVLLDESFKMAMDPDVDPRVRAKLMGDTVRWAGFDKSGGMPDATGGFSVTINLNGMGRKGETLDGEVIR